MAKRKGSLEKHVLMYFKNHHGKDVLDVAQHLNISLLDAVNETNKLIRAGKLVPDANKEENVRYAPGRLKR